ncbi:cytochrome P450 [Cokeromyces recurvatus]|uniref:cytochrome P450 n=1 Tax=Cokeromyces recurvatus TaxID=90255 RepID=UPI00221F8EF8|nr:cytochrome P450 [Cokeromyces recurvatus]KAI7898001.1 cytochrome P450 [Cokeromyces recurvatus]
MVDTTISLIIVIKGSKDVETNGKIIGIGNGANTNTVRSLAAEKLGLAIPLDDIVLETPTGEVLTEIDKVKSQHVVYINVKNKIKTIPGPPRLPMIGNFYEMMPDLSAGWARQFEKYGPLVSISILGADLVATNDPDITELLVKESEYFTKKITVVLQEIKQFAGNGLFTSDTDDNEWKLAHKLLMPAFSPRAIKAYQPEMGKIVQETMKILSEYRPDEKVEILQWCTNLTFETIGRIGFGYSFDLMYRDKPPHPFIEAMGYILGQSVNRFGQPTFFKKLPTAGNRAWDHNIKLMHTIVEDVIKDRKDSKDAKNMEKDLLGFMLNAHDEHNLGLSDENIRDQVITFLIAGHDTTANTLAWTLYEFTRNPDVETKVLQEIANAGITSDKLPTPEQINSLKYLSKVLKEVLRLHPPIRNINKYCKKDCIVPGGYLVPEGTNCVVSVLNLHTNPIVYPNPYKFDPERFSPEEEQNRSRYSWLPFSTGPRSCIGMAFALQEAKTVLSMFLHKFKFCYDGPPVKYDPYQATTKPMDMMMTIHPRTDFPKSSQNIVIERKKTSNNISSVIESFNNRKSISTIELPKATFLFGTQTGTAQDYANQLATQAKQFGFKNVTLCTMDQWKVIQTGTYESPKDMKKRELVVICTATYNGYPPDSAEHFNKFLDANIQQENENLLSGIDYAVFGLGNKNWRTYQAFPLKVDKFLYQLGADRFFSPGNGNADKDMDSHFMDWCSHFWAYLLAKYGVSVPSSYSLAPTVTSSTEDFKSCAVKLQFIPPCETNKWELARQNKNGKLNAKILNNCELQKEGSGRSTRHIEIDISQLTPLNEHSLYNAGDHIEILPENSIEVVERIAIGFGFVLDSVFEIAPESISNFSPRSLAATIKGPCTVRNALMYYADLLSAPSRRMLGYFAAQLRVSAPKVAYIFDKLTMPDENNEDQYPEFIKKYRTLLDLQMAFPQVNQLELEQFLATVNVMQPRRYSIASSPLVYPTEAHISVSVVHDFANDRYYPGLASSYLKRLEEHGQLRASLKSSKNTFNMPSNPETPLIMIAAGTGIAPFRGFLQERKFLKDAGQKVGSCTLFFGCRHPEQDHIYSDEIDNYVASGVIVSNHVAFSRMDGSPQKYVQHKILIYAGEIWSLISNGAAVYVCGAGAMSQDVRKAFEMMVKCFGYAQTNKKAEKYLKELEEKKLYMVDVWG